MRNLNRTVYVPRCSICGDRMAPRKQEPFLCPDCNRIELASLKPARKPKE